VGKNDQIQKVNERETGVGIIEPTLTRVTLEYSDGTLNFVEGEDAEKWIKFIDSALVMSYIHGGRQPDVDLQQATMKDVFRFFWRQTTIRFRQLFR
jgi:hypothetical protein